jgi:hypothetical protein
VNEYLLEINPLLPILAFSLAFLFFQLIRRQPGKTIWSAVALLFLLFLLLPGGRAISDRTARLPEIGMRGSCLLESIKRGGPFVADAARNPDCAYQRSGFVRSR